MDTIKFKDWKENPQLYEKRFDGFNQFEITFKEWAECDAKLLKNILNGAGKFYIVNKDNNIVTSKNQTNFPDKTDFEKHANDFQNKQSITPVENNIDGNGMVDFYTIIFLWCLNDKGDEIAKPFSSVFTGNQGRYINIAGESIHLGASNDRLHIGVQHLINYLSDYSNYKIIFTPNCKRRQDNNNGGNNKMSDKDTNLEINAYISEKIDAHKQIIFTGAPGTGKTFSVREYVKRATRNDESRYKFVQFHSSYDYTDFVEGIRPVPKGNSETNDSGENMFVRMDGNFKAFCRKIVNVNIDFLKNNKVLTETEINDIYYKNESKADTKEKMKSISDSIKEKIEKEEIPMYYFVIDEINRADLSKVFGELMFGLEEDYRGVQNRFPTQYSNLPTYRMNETGTAERIDEDCFKNGFFVPENLTIIGTMNDIDRSVETFDFALRRRFAWVEIKANDVMLKSVAAINGIKEDKIDSDFDEIINRIKEMNKVISEKEGKNLGLNESYHIGPAYFKNLFDESGDANLETIFNEKIEPILREYTRGRNSDKVETFVVNCNNALLGRNKND